MSGGDIFVTPKSWGFSASFWPTKMRRMVVSPPLELETGPVSVWMCPRSLSSAKSRWSVRSVMVPTAPVSGSSWVSTSSRASLLA